MTTFRARPALPAVSAVDRTDATLATAWPARDGMADELERFALGDGSLADAAFLARAGIAVETDDDEAARRDVSEAAVARLLVFANELETSAAAAAIDGYAQ